MAAAGDLQRETILLKVLFSYLRGFESKKIEFELFLSFTASFCGFHPDP